MRSMSGPAALGTVSSFFDGLPGIWSEKPSSLMVSHDEDEVVVVGVTVGEYDGEATGVVPLVGVVGSPELCLEMKTIAAMPTIKTRRPPTIHGSGLRFGCA
jgi:hypothetical protein